MGEIRRGGIDWKASIGALQKSHLHSNVVIITCFVMDVCVGGGGEEQLLEKFKICTSYAAALASWRRSHPVLIISCTPGNCFHTLTDV